MCADVVEYGIHFELSLIECYQLIYEMPLNWLFCQGTSDEGAGVIAKSQMIGWMGIPWNESV